jgi:hypothetical protein
LRLYPVNITIEALLVYINICLNKQQHQLIAKFES